MHVRCSTAKALRLSRTMTHYQVIGPDSARTATVAADPKSTMKLISITQRIAYKLREKWLLNC